MATPTVAGVADADKQQWMCHAMVLPDKPLNFTSMTSVLATRSICTVAWPVPGEALGGDSLGPLRSGTNVSAYVPGTGSTRAATRPHNRMIHLILSLLSVVVRCTGGPLPLPHAGLGRSRSIAREQ